MAELIHRCTLFTLSLLQQMTARRAAYENDEKINSRRYIRPLCSELPSCPLLSSFNVISSSHAQCAWSGTRGERRPSPGDMQKHFGHNLWREQHILPRCAERSRRRCVLLPIAPRSSHRVPWIYDWYSSLGVIQHAEPALRR